MCNHNELVEQQFFKAIRYRDGFGGETRDLQKAYDMLYSLALRGYPKAMNSIGSMYSRGQLLKDKAKSLTKALEWYQMVAEAGSLSATLNLADCYHQGLGCEPDSVAACHLLEPLDLTGVVEATALLDVIVEKFAQCVRKETERCREGRMPSDAVVTSHANI